jgi:hypothetical protein
MLNNRVGFVQNGIVPESDNPPPAILQIFSSPGVIFQPLRMLPAVELDDQSPLNARKIDNIEPYRMLPAKFTICDIPAAQPKPQTAFGIGLSFA